MLDRIKLYRVTLALAGVVIGAGCEQPGLPRFDADLLGSNSALAVAATTSGSDNDPDGYTARIDTSLTQHVDPNGLVTFSGLADGDHRVDLYGTAENCWAIGNDPRTVTITALSGATRFDVGCVAGGSLFVTNSTTGVDLDSDGYTVTVDGSAGRTIAANDTAWFNGLSSYSTHSVALSGIASNCTVSGANPQTVSVSSGGTTTLTFSLSCAPVGGGTGTLTVATSTTGTILDPDGYTVTIDGTTSRPIGLTGNVSFAVPAGSHPVALSGVAANCSVSGADRRLRQAQALQSFGKVFAS